MLELGETIEAGLRREVEEEAGVKIDIGPLTGVYQNVPGGIVALVFRCTTTDVPVESSAEAFTVAWRCRADVAKLMTDTFTVRVRDAALFREAHGPHIRSHDGQHLL